MRIAIALIAAISISQLAGCATKSYGRQTALTPYERQNLTCREIDIELAKANGFVQTVKEGDKFDAKTVLGLLGDLGIGNVLEHNAAMDSGTKRIADLQALHAARNCGTDKVAEQTAQPSATAANKPQAKAEEDAPKGNLWGNQ